MKQDEKSSKGTVKFKDSLSGVWVDGISIGVRGDGIVTLSFLQQTPENLLAESARVIMTLSTTQRLCEQIQEAIKNDDTVTEQK